MPGGQSAPAVGPEQLSRMHRVIAKRDAAERLKPLVVTRPQSHRLTNEIGGRGRDRTGDPLLAKQVLSQLSYTPTVTP